MRRLKSYAVQRLYMPVREISSNVQERLCLKFSVRIQNYLGERVPRFSGQKILKVKNCF